MSIENKELMEGAIGSIGHYDVEFKDGKLVAQASASAEGIDAQMSMSISGKSILDGIAKKIGGPIPEAVAEFLEMSLGLK